MSAIASPSPPRRVDRLKAEARTSFTEPAWFATTIMRGFIVAAESAQAWLWTSFVSLLPQPGGLGEIFARKQTARLIRRPLQRLGLCEEDDPLCGHVLG